MPHPPHDLVRAVRAELAVPGRYHFSSPHGVRRSWLELAFGWVSERYKEFLDALSRHLHVGPRGVALFGDVLIVLSVIAIGYVAARLLIALQLERSAHARTAGFAPARSAHALYVRATESAGAGDYTRAVRMLFAAAVVLLDLRGVVRDDESATVNELRREVRRRNTSAEEPFVSIARAYTAAAYAEESLDARTWDAVRAAYLQLSSTVTSP